MQEITRLLDRTMTNLDTILAERERMIAERDRLGSHHRNATKKIETGRVRCCNTDQTRNLCDLPW